MERVTQVSQKGNAAMPTDPDLLGWTSGPLPTAELEHIAWTLFGFDHGESHWDLVLSATRDDYRRLALQLRAKFQKADRPAPETDVPDWAIPRGVEGVDPRWLDAWFSAQLANVISLHIWGKPLNQMSPRVRADVREYADAVVEDAVKLYAPILDPQTFGRRESKGGVM